MCHELLDEFHEIVEVAIECSIVTTMGCCSKVGLSELSFHGHF